MGGLINVMAYIWLITGETFDELWHNTMDYLIKRPVSGDKKAESYDTGEVFSAS